MLERSRTAVPRDDAPRDRATNANESKKKTRVAVAVAVAVGAPSARAAQCPRVARRIAISTTRCHFLGHFFGHFWGLDRGSARGRVDRRPGASTVVLVGVLRATYDCIAFPSLAYVMSCPLIGP